MIGLVVVSHSSKAAEGICEIAAQMAGGATIEPAGGDGEGGIGTSAPRIQDAIETVDDGDGVVILVDLGSAVMNAELAIEMAETESDVVIADAPVLEGALNGAVEASNTKATVESVVEKAEDAREYHKVN
ncbi:dihydroxyacetone kinase phosphoryl donor subunit DhaM [Natronocalculus amylovorans]|uniref:phosphoenolpyruvate--glycerone phosphotransferase n=1 Tax=Natronocalculus amylovorans TaxID=2917812 RepID=A0AAE3FYC4_9EURY|nr:dihydroxyacetone kinase phosphoryl donor subunit DhaM [Natronocalculus amylovorans]MCL9817130.1 PTS-dependent dihydroxyacetone kinase phosphotransferase subunit DhaM [Natronocalculus amylovorans]NUE02843.1 PTS-dependent dihydroxyacetone kinase phosphotransferase subunit DhaM [Halorubraceae archaeon YAN]